jgi:methionyl-tRNA formyltransferase
MLTEIVKEGRYWRVLVDSKSVERWFRRKRDAVQKVSDLREQSAYEARILAEDRGHIVWTPEDEKQIDEYAEALRQNPEAWSLVGKRPLQHRARIQHLEEANTIQQWEMGEPVSDYGQLVCARLRRIRAAREEAFRRAGAVL